jgi:hypothetical protein|tara:strand:+ start:1715 stop:2362 length:648 start_codon:yes stop_codon:yes gene_type:complete
MLKGAFAGLVLSLSGFVNAGLITENFDDGLAQGWSLTGLWHVTGNNPNGSAGALGYVQGETTGTVLDGNFDVGGLANSGTATSNIFHCQEAVVFGCTVTFDFLDSSENYGFDQLDVYILHNGLETLILENSDLNDDGQYRTMSYDIQALIGNSFDFKVMFKFDTIDHIANNFSGPRIDNFIIVSDDISSEVPEPSTLAIFALGIMGLAARRFKKQ